MPTENFHDYLMSKGRERMKERRMERKAQPISRPSTQPAGVDSVAAQAVRRQAVAQSHNTFRPDIYRVSEGYLN